jgi:hypothetical protein
MPFAINQDVIQALAPERADQALGIWILPERRGVYDDDLESNIQVL